VIFDGVGVNKWTEVQVIVQTIGTLGAILGLIYSLRNFNKTLRDNYYGELDKMYFDLLQIVVERPHLLMFAKSAASEKQRADETARYEYHAYAFMVWNFLETIFDRCLGNDQLMDTWKGVLKAESSLHREWFADPNNKWQFKQPFIDFVESNLMRDTSG
jgi:hypothetical protein